MHHLKISAGADFCASRRLAMATSSLRRAFSKSALLALLMITMAMRLIFFDISGLAAYAESIFGISCYVLSDVSG